MGLTVQPFVIVVGDLEEGIQSYVSVDATLYKLESALKALDVCFKAIHALNAKYPPEAEQVWLLIQRGIFEIVTKWDKQIPSVTAILSSL